MSSARSRLPARVIARKIDVNRHEHHPRQHTFPDVIRFGWQGNDREHFGVIGVVQAEISNSWIRRNGGQAEATGNLFVSGEQPCIVAPRPRGRAVWVRGGAASDGRPEPQPVAYQNVFNFGSGTHLLNSSGRVLLRFSNDHGDSADPAG